MIQLSAAGKRFGHKLLFENADWMITSHDRIGLVGANGTGKSTLMKIFAGIETLDYGSISTPKGTSPASLPPPRPPPFRNPVLSQSLALFSHPPTIQQKNEHLT